MSRKPEDQRSPFSEAHERVAAAARALAEGERVRGQALLALAEATDREADSNPDERISHALRHQAAIARARAETSAHKATSHDEEAKTEETAAQLADQRARMALPDQQDPQAVMDKGLR